MDRISLTYQPIEGKTYSLFGNSGSTKEYYLTIGSLADLILAQADIDTVLEAITTFSSRRRYLRRILSGSSDGSVISFCLNSIHNELKPYTQKTADHLKTLPLWNLRDRRLATTEEQYHLYMLEIELTNRKYKGRFLECQKRISLQPYCLQDFSVNCKAEDTGFDNQCRFCSKNCFQNHASRILKEQGVEPYIWTRASIGNSASCI
jgi:hypothetical protein